MAATAEALGVTTETVRQRVRRAIARGLDALAANAAQQPRPRLLFADTAWRGLTTALGKVWARRARPVLAVRGGRS